MKNVDHSYEQALIMHDNVHVHVIMNIIVTPTSQVDEKRLAIFLEKANFMKCCCQSQAPGEW